MRRKALVSALGAHPAKRTTVSVVSSFRGEERRYGGIPDHLTDGLHVRKMTIHPVVVNIRKCRSVVRLPPNTSRMEAVPEENPGTVFGANLAEGDWPTGLGSKSMRAPTRILKPLSSPRPCREAQGETPLCFEILWAMQKWRAAKDHHF